MTRYTGPKNRVARRFGINIFGRTRNPLIHKSHPPGMHGARRRKKSDYGIRLEEKQKLKAMYGMLTERQLVNYYKAAAQKEGNTVEFLMARLECRLDNLIYRLKLAPTIFAAQQLVSHGHILVDGKKVDRRSFEVRPGMVLSIKEKSRNMKIINEALDNTGRAVPSYLVGGEDKYSGQLLARPKPDEIPLAAEVNLSEICDFLAHTT